MGGSSKSQTVGYKYYVGMHAALTHGPVDRVVRMRVDKKDVFIGNLESGSTQVSAEGLFGGESREGGVAGTIDFEPGGKTQGQNSYLASKLGSLVPNFRGVAALVFRQVYMGMNPYLKKWDFRLQRILTRQDGEEQWYPVKAGIRAPGISLGGTTFTEAFASGLTLYSLINGTLTPFEIVTDAYGPAMKVTGTGTNTIRRSIPRYAVTGMKCKFKILTTGTNDYGSLTFLDASGTFSVGFNSGREASLDSLRRPKLQVQIGGVTTDFNAADASLSTNVFYSFEMTFNASTGLITTKLVNLDTATTVKETSVSVASVADVAFLQFKTENAAGGGTTIWSDISLSASIGQLDMNPAHIIRECLTDRNWGMGYLEADVDDAAFTTAADTLHSEGMGISLLWDRQVPLEDFIKEIIKHIDGTLFVDRLTGKFKLRLVRDDFVAGDLLVLDENSVEKVENGKTPQTGELTNSVSLTYWDALTGNRASLTVQDIALVHSQGSPINTSLQYPGFSNGTIAARVAMRDLKALSTPLFSCTIYANRKAAQLEIGQAFKLVWPDLEVDMVMRVTGLAYGNGRTNKVRVTATQDVFSLPEVIYAVPPASEWAPADSEAQPVTNALAVEAPYYEVVQQQGQRDVDNLLAEDPTVGFLVVAGARPTAASINADVQVSAGGPFETRAKMDFCPSAVLTNAISYTDTALTVTVATGVDLDLVGVGSHAQVGTELVGVDAINTTTGVMTVKRAVLDTVPVPHAAGDRIYFWDLYNATDGLEYVDAEVVQAKLLTVASGGALPSASAPALSVTMDQRAVRPYPPGNVKVNGAYFPEAIMSPAGRVFTWAHRDRLQQTAGLNAFTEGNIGPEAGVTYTIQLYGDGGVLKRTQTGITGTTFTYSEADETTDNGGALNNSVQAILKSERGGLASTQSHDIIVDRADYGYSYGQYYGGY